MVVTVWVPLQRTTPAMGSLIFSRRLSGNEGAMEDDDQAGGSDAAQSPGAELALASSRPTSRLDDCLDAWGVVARGGGAMDEQSDEYDRLVNATLEADGFVPDMQTYELGDISIHLTSCFHRTGPNMAGTPRVILAATYFAEGLTARLDVSEESMTQGQRNDWRKFAPGVAPGDVVATPLNPLLVHASNYAA